MRANDDRVKRSRPPIASFVRFANFRAHVVPFDYHRDTFCAVATALDLPRIAASTFIAPPSSPPRQTIYSITRGNAKLFNEISLAGRGDEIARCVFANSRHVSRRRERGATKQAREERDYSARRANTLFIPLCVKELK